MWVPHVSTILVNLLDNVVIIIKEIQKFFLNDLNFEIQYILNHNSYSKTVYMKIDQKNITNTNTLSVCLPPLLTYRTSTFPPLGCLSVIPGTGKDPPDEVVLNMKVARNGSTIIDDLSTCLLGVSNTADMEPSPSGS